jgi:mitochondrial chaperone BCS1
MIETLWAAVLAYLQTDLFKGGFALGVAGAAAAMATRIPAVARFLVESHLITTLTVDSRSALFDAVVAWLADHPYSRRCRRLMVTRSRHDDDAGVLFSPAEGTHLLWRGTTVLWVRRERERGGGRGSLGLREPLETITLRALSRDRTILTNLVIEADGRFGDKDPNRLIIHGADDYGDWNERARIRRRPLPSVILAEGVAEDLLADAQTFLASEAWYVARGIPWRRGYLLYGPPGTGKTSIIKALAGELSLDLSLLTLASERLDDQQLCALMGSAPSRSLLLLEDVDAVFRGREAGDAAKGVTFSGLLNAIDGVLSQEGHMLVLTTNHVERLDPALIRPGRIDWKREIGLAHGEQVARLFRAFYPEREDLAAGFIAALGGHPVAPAAVQGHFLRHRDDPERAVQTAAVLIGFDAIRHDRGAGSTEARGDEGSS